MRYNWLLILCLSALAAALPQASAGTWYVPMADSEPGGFDFIQILTAPDYRFAFPAITAFSGPDAEGKPSLAAEQWVQTFPSSWTPTSDANPNFATASGPTDGYEFLAFAVWIEGNRQVDRPVFHYQTYLSGNLVGNWDVVCTGPGELDWRVDPGTWAVTSPYPYWLPGDVNCDALVDAADFITLKRNFGRSGNVTWLQGDFDHDFDVDHADLLALMGNMGESSSIPVAPSSNAPEPGTLILLAGLGAATLGRRRRQAK